MSQSMPVYGENAKGAMKNNVNLKLTRHWIRCWQKVGVELDNIRRENIRCADTRQAIENLDDAFESALLHQVPRTHSGLVQQQAFFHKRRS